MLQKTLVLLKPDCMQKRLAGKVLDRFETAGLKIVGMKMINLTQEMLDHWYAHHKDKPFFKDLCQFMMQTPVLALVLEAANAVEKVREIIGPTDSQAAPKGTVRGDWGDDVQKNLVHASDAPERAEYEVGLLFKEGEIFEW